MLHQITTPNQRLTLSESPPAATEKAFSQSVREGLLLNRKAVPSRYFYDSEGSRLFEQITDLPEYYLTRCEQSILDRHASTIVAEIGPPFEIVEFGGGSSKKTRRLIEAALSAHDDLQFVSIDISKDFLVGSAELLLADYPGISITAVAAEYFSGLKLLPPRRSHRLFLFLGSNVGNFEDAEAGKFLSAINAQMASDDMLLVGFDLVKDRNLIERAYNDSAGVTAAFNKNLLVRINSELGGAFDLDLFSHHAPYLEDQRHVEMRLVSEVDQEVPIGDLGLNVHFSKGEYIHTENSRKYTDSDIIGLAQSSGLEVDDCWRDDNGWFGLFLLKKA